MTKTIFAMIAVLDSGKHSHEHFQFDSPPNRIKVQTLESNGMYGRDKASIYQDTGRYSSGCRVYTFVRSTSRKIRGLLETDY